MKNPPFLLFLHHLPAQLLSNSGSDDPLEGVELPELPAPHSLARTPRAKQLEALPGLPMPEENGRERSWDPQQSPSSRPKSLHVWEYPNFERQILASWTKPMSIVKKNDYDFVAPMRRKSLCLEGAVCKKNPGVGCA